MSRAAGVFVAVLFLVEAPRDGGSPGLRPWRSPAAPPCVFVTTVPPSAWGTAHATPFPSPQFAVAGLAGAGLASSPRSRVAERNWPCRRLVSLGRAGRGRWRLSAWSCSRNAWPTPMPGWIRACSTYWLDHVAEAQPLWSVVADDPATAAAHYVTPLIGARGAWRFASRRGGWRRAGHALSPRSCWPPCRQLLAGSRLVFSIPLAA